MRSKVGVLILSSLTVVYFWFRALWKSCHGGHSLYSDLIVFLSNSQNIIGEISVNLYKTTKNTLPISVSELWPRASTSSSRCARSKLLARRNVITPCGNLRCVPGKAAEDLRACVCLSFPSRVRFFSFILAFYLSWETFGAKVLILNSIHLVGWNSRKIRFGEVITPASVFPLRVILLKESLFQTGRGTWYWMDAENE